MVSSFIMVVTVVVAGRWATGPITPACHSGLLVAASRSAKSPPAGAGTS
jgi:hypothetical protein